MIAVTAQNQWRMWLAIGDDGYRTSIVAFRQCGHFCANAPGGQVGDCCRCAGVHLKRCRVCQEGKHDLHHS